MEFIILIIILIILALKEPYILGDPDNFTLVDSSSLKYTWKQMANQLTKRGAKLYKNLMVHYLIIQKNSL